MKLEDFNYNLPQECIAQYPSEQRDQSRLLVLSKTDGSWEDKVFCDIESYLNPGDILVLNETKVIPARLFGQRPTGGKVELFLLNRVEGDTWEVLARPGKRVRIGDI
ncbi:MAG: S-adenosylmethionine:tRNA ribosyltransferase-isomerase, partial [Bacillota bacterium]|nr:S-adenosylmethionine:tRNA ribosyltransferase-isomerase [Bacillota bacterium]